MDDASKKQQHQDALAVAQNGGVTNSDDGNMDDSDDDLDDDDMMDKISSSPSIEDGGYTSIMPPQQWPRRVDSLPVMRDRGSPASPTFSEARSSSPYTESLEYPHAFPSWLQSNAAADSASHHHLRGEYTG
ncbi:uncharacterized protein GLRG_00420 [Colletotrichum graminicola M1.001]|uniref:Uncharacterized protein n=1 Tax=Colletotrichum graminicola (strain M1.001 / M2 / FGSC 10212) TaxID=645133 RepID=E3Q2H5_COLGM|nr:uncharacterized protein GLRG_00420 [Colletotrichum graminicola M1.001]EFQ25276.1 hypothetical protein GLRG_00420 [Colletotrichum graminicola M1.001]